jgi:hypothetical protein
MIMSATQVSATINAFRLKPLSDPIFTLPTGANEFDLIKVESVYYFAYDDHTTTRLASSTTLAGLQTATRTTPRPDGHYPSIQFDGTSWHLWVWETTCTNHYIASSFDGTYVFSDKLPDGLTDIAVRNLSDGIYYAGYKDNNLQPARVGVLVSRSPAGPWLDLGYCFSRLGESDLHSAEEADPAIFEADSQVFLVFSGYDGGIQRVMISQIDQAGKALAPPMTVANPPIGQAKIFNGVYLHEDSEPDRIYVSENTTTPGVPGGWRYVQAGNAPTDDYRPADVVRVTFDNTAPMDISNGTPVSLSANTQPTAGGLVLSASDAGAYGIASLSTLNDFALVIDITVTNLPASGNFGLITRISTRDASTQPIVGVWLTASGQLYSEIRKAGNVDSLVGNWNITLTVGTRYSVTLKRTGSSVIGQVDAQTYFSGRFDGSLDGFEEWTVGNQSGRFTNPSQPFTGTIHRLIAVSAPLHADDC